MFYLRVILCVLRDGIVLLIQVEWQVVDLGRIGRNRSPEITLLIRHANSYQAAYQNKNDLHFRIVLEELMAVNGVQLPQ